MGGSSRRLSQAEALLSQSCVGESLRSVGVRRSESGSGGCRDVLRPPTNRLRRLTPPKGESGQTGDSIQLSQNLPPVTDVTVAPVSVTDDASSAVALSQRSLPGGDEM